MEPGSDSRRDNPKRQGEKFLGLDPTDEKGTNRESIADITSPKKRSAPRKLASSSMIYVNKKQKGVMKPKMVTY